MLSYWLATETALTPAPAVSMCTCSAFSTALQLLCSAGRGALAAGYRCLSLAGTQGSFVFRGFSCFMFPPAVLGCLTLFSDVV